MVLSDRTKGCCSSDLNEPLHPNHDQFAELDAHNFPAAKGERPLSVQSRVLRGDAGQRARRAVNGHSAAKKLLPQSVTGALPSRLREQTLILVASTNERGWEGKKAEAHSEA